MMNVLNNDRLAQAQAANAPNAFGKLLGDLTTTATMEIVSLKPKTIEAHNLDSVTVPKGTFVYARQIDGEWIVVATSDFQPMHFQEINDHR